MENHPIPQDITGFQFKLIGSMTVKQFLYLAVGIIIGWFVFSSSLIFFIKWPLVILFGGGGVALAFVPIGGRPMDLMISNFIKTFFRESTFVYDKTGGSLQQTAAANHPAPQPVAQPTVHTPTVQPVHEVNPTLKAELAPASSPTAPAQFTVSMSAPQKEEILSNEKPAEISHPKEVSQPTAQPQPNLQQAPQAVTTVPQNPAPQPLQQSAANMPPPAPLTGVTPLSVRQVPASQTRSVGIPATPEAPNLVTGIIKDPRGNPLPNILVEIKDKEGNPVRAFKTNGLGHFASATALLDGSYTIEFEDIKAENKFQKIAFEAKGQVIMPFEIISTDKREELRKELFPN